MSIFKLCLEYGEFTVSIEGSRTNLHPFQEPRQLLGSLFFLVHPGGRMEVRVLWIKRVRLSGHYSMRDLQAPLDLLVTPFSLVPRAVPVNSHMISYDQVLPTSDYCSILTSGPSKPGGPEVPFAPYTLRQEGKQ